MQVEYVGGHMHATAVAVTQVLVHIPMELDPLLLPAAIAHLNKQASR